jgi:hypothetical protein
VTELLTSSPSNQIPDISLAAFDGNVDFGGPSGFTSPQLTDAEVGNLSVPPRGVLTLAPVHRQRDRHVPGGRAGLLVLHGEHRQRGLAVRAARRGAPDRHLQLHGQAGSVRAEHRRKSRAACLLFPRFDNRTNTITAITVTNTNCDFTPGPGPLLNGTVDIEYVYIGRYGPDDQELDCLETNRTRRLTPCDTITLLTRFDNPQVERGFLYVFAKDPQTGQAIVWNHLIGQALYIGSNAIDDDPAEDALNARTFLGIGDERTATDHDADGIRDLDGVEYSEAPDEILIPRFLGQDGDDKNGPTGFHSRLVLLGLSGGSQFTTQVSILFYNDNEQTFSTQWTFRCWDDPRLTEIDDGFLETFLDTTDNAPNEIIGATNKESGWIRVERPGRLLQSPTPSTTRRSTPCSSNASARTSCATCPGNCAPSRTATSGRTA